MKKIFLILGIGILALIVVVALIAGFYLGPIVKLGVEQIGPKVTQTSLKVDSVNILLLSGGASINGLVVGNPEKFTAPEAIRVGHIAISLDPGSVLTHKILIHSIQIQSPQITYEAGLRGSNLSKILKNVNAFSNSSPAASNNSTSHATDGAKNKPAPKIEVDDLLITGARVQIYISSLGNKSIALPDIHLTNLGKGNDGLTPVELTSAILKAIITDTLNMVTGSVGNIGQSITNLKSSFGSLFGK